MQSQNKNSPHRVAKFFSIGPQVFWLNGEDFAPSGSHSNEDVSFKYKICHYQIFVHFLI
jgi:hypothetical protein